MTVVLSRKERPLQVGDEVEHSHQPKKGIVVEINPDKLPLIGVDTGAEFISFIPAIDLEHTVKEPITEQVVCRSGLTGTRSRLRSRYSMFEEWKMFSDMYDLARRLKYKTAQAAWDENPLIESSVNPLDFRKVKEAK
jgi:hypothetical protein